jgi:hypothetical protein
LLTVVVVGLAVFVLVTVEVAVVVLVVVLVSVLVVVVVLVDALEELDVSVEVAATALPPAAITAASTTPASAATRAREMARTRPAGRRSGGVVTLSVMWVVMRMRAADQVTVAVQRSLMHSPDALPHRPHRADCGGP